MVITNENYKMYRDYYKKIKRIIREKDFFMGVMIIGGIAIIGGIGILNMALSLPVVLLPISGAVLAKVYEVLSIYQLKSEFEKKYPDFDRDVDMGDLEASLERSKLGETLRKGLIGNLKIKEKPFENGTFRFKTDEELDKFYASFDQEKIDEIHAKGKITPEEKVKEWESHGLCAPGDAIGSASDRCRTFKNCNECLREFASYKDEHKKFEFVLDKSFIDEEPIVKKHTL